MGDFQLSVMGGRKNRRNGTDSFRNNKTGKQSPTVSKTCDFSYCELLAEGHHFYLFAAGKRERKK